MHLCPPKLYVIADRGCFGSTEKWLKATKVVAGHLSEIQGSALQIRVKAGTTHTRSSRLRRAREVVDKAMNSGLRVLANTTLDEAVTLNFSGAHFSEYNTPSKPISRHSIPTNFLIGASTHNETSIQKATTAGAHFILLSPVFPPLSKDRAGMGLEQFSALSLHSQLPVLALGGIVPERVAPCLKAGASGVAMISSVMKTSTPKTVLTSIHSELKKYSNGKTL